MFKFKPKLLTLLLPSVFSFAYTVIERMHQIKEQTLWMIVAVFYVVTILGIVLYIKSNSSNPLLLAMSFVLSPLLPYFYEATHPEFFNFYFSTLSVVLFYALPFLIASIVIAVKMNERKKTDGNGG